MNTLVNINEIERIIGYSFVSKEYPILAFTHSSFANENGCQSNERVEFLGDSILNFIVAEALFSKSSASEGKLSRTRSNIVSEAPLASAVKALGLERYLLIGRSLVTVTDAVMADLFEAVVGAIYLDGGMEPARKFVLSALSDVISSGRSARMDYKSMLYELSQEQRFDVEFVEVGKDGPDHNPTFTCAVLVNGKELGRANAGSKKSAETAAAGIALGVLRSK